ncbi:MAG: GGDEF domain-containing protein [Helicobacteraceae bacterium]
MISMIKIFGLKRAILAYTFVAMAITFLVTSVLYFLVFDEVKFAEVFISMLIPAVVIGLLVPKIVELYSVVNFEKEKNKTMSGYDEVTGFYNKKTFLSHLRREINSFKRYKTQLCVMLIEISNYKEIEKKRGRHITDYVLKEISSKICHNFRKSDILARYRENSFAVILPHTSLEKSNTVKTKIEEILQAKPIYFKDEINVQTNIKIQAVKNEESENEDSILDRLEK